MGHNQMHPCYFNYSINSTDLIKLVGILQEWIRLLLFLCLFPVHVGDIVMGQPYDGVDVIFIHCNFEYQLDIAALKDGSVPQLCTNPVY